MSFRQLKWVVNDTRSSELIHWLHIEFDLKLKLNFYLKLKLNFDLKLKLNFDLKFDLAIINSALST